MDKKNLVLVVVALIILAGGAGYYFWSKQYDSNISEQDGETALGSGSSFLDTFFGKIIPNDKESQANLKEYKDAKGIFSITYPSSWIVRPDQGRRLTGVNITPQELLSRYPPEEQGFIKGLIVSADQSEESPEGYFRRLVFGGETGETEAKTLTVNNYPAYLVKGSIRGISYVIYVVSDDKYIVYFNYRTQETEEAHQNDIRKPIDFAPYEADFEATVHSIRFSK